jgi:RNA polymerase sigma-70 factor (ECF subfamily)
LELETLVEQCRAGDEGAWEALVRRTQGRVFGLCFHYLRDREEAREVAQETYIRIYRALDSFDGSGSFLAWSVRIARNCCLDRLRKQKITPTFGAAEMDDPDNHREFVEPGESFVDTHVRHELLRRALEGMSAINREMILLKDIQGLKQREIADLLSIPIGTVKARSNRARAELADRMLELDPSYGASP